MFEDPKMLFGKVFSKSFFRNKISKMTFEKAFRKAFLVQKSFLLFWSLIKKLLAKPNAFRKDFGEVKSFLPWEVRRLLARPKPFLPWEVKRGFWLRQSFFQNKELIKFYLISSIVLKKDFRNLISKSLFEKLLALPNAFYSQKAFWERQGPEKIFGYS